MKLTDKNGTLKSSIIAGVAYIIGVIAMFLGKLNAEYVALVSVIIIPLLTYKGYKIKRNNH